MTKSLKSLWGRFLFQDKGILPTKRFLLLYFFVSLGLLVGSFVGISWAYIFVVNMIILIASLFDLFISPRKKDLKVKRNITNEMERGLPYHVKIEIKNTSNHSFVYRLIDSLPQSFTRPFPVKGIAQKEGTVITTFETVATDRGKYDLNKLYFRYTSLIGLWEKQITIEEPAVIKVIPDLTETKQYLENAQRFLLFEGEKIRKNVSGVGDFAKIRSYVVGDDPRKINWRQTAKLCEVMTNEFEPEHGKYITILIDCGRMMGAELEKGNRLEKAIEASLTVAAAALQKGDYVSVIAFSKDVKVYVPPAKGLQHLQTILQSLYDVQVDAAESNYASVLTFLETMQKKRSLLLLFSDVTTFLHEESGLGYLKRLRQRHLFFMIGIEDKTLLERVKDEPVDVHSAMLKSIAQQQILRKKREKRKWEKHGLHIVEAKEEKLATAAVSYYIDIMNRNLL